MIEQYALPVSFIAVLLLSLSWHEAAHAWVADRLGDPTARSLGRVSLNPLRHLDPFLSVVLPTLLWLTAGFVFGGGKPVPINPAYFRNKARDFMLVALAGPASNLLLAVGFVLLYAVLAATGVLQGDAPGTIPQAQRMGLTYVTAGPPSLLADLEGFRRGGLPAEGLRLLLFVGAGINVLLALFNLVPVPPLDGSRVIGWLLPASLQGAWYRLDRIGIFVVLFLVLVLPGAILVFRAALAAFRLLATGADQLIAVLT